VINTVQQQVRKGPLLRVKTASLVNARHLITVVRAGPREHCLPVVAIADPFVKHEHLNEIEAIQYSLKH
jgi:hypothetical protein